MSRCTPHYLIISNFIRIHLSFSL